LLDNAKVLAEPAPTWSKVRGKVKNEKILAQTGRVFQEQVTGGIK
jgi:hypothetical protein